MARLNALCMLVPALWAAQVSAANQEQELDLEYGEEINETCAGCHGEFGEGSIDGEYPRLAGIPASYLVKQLRLFKTRERLNIPMTPYTNDRELPEEDIQVIAAYLSQIELPTKLPPIDEDTYDALERLQASKRVINIPPFSGDAEKGKAIYRDECASCHAKDGYGKKDVPMLAGQRSEYLLRQFINFQEGGRIHDDEPDDAEIFKAFDEASMNGLLAYLSSLDDN